MSCLILLTEKGIPLLFIIIYVDYLENMVKVWEFIGDKSTKLQFLKTQANVLKIDLFIYLDYH